MTNSDRNVYWSENGRSWKSPSKGKVGMAVTTFSTSDNEAPEKPWTNLMGYNTIGGLTSIIGKETNGITMCDSIIGYIS